MPHAGQAPQSPPVTAATTMHPSAGPQPAMQARPPGGAGLAGGATAGPHMSEAEKAALEKERALQERLDKRATIVATVLRKFVTAFYTGRQRMLDEARAAALAKKARRGKRVKKKKKSKDAEKDKKAAKGKDGKVKKTKTPVQEAWAAFLADMDERISKQKRVTLEDVYRGVQKLDGREACALAALLATTTKKILPPDSLNINQLNLREALMAASAARQLPVERAVPGEGKCPGLQIMTERGAPPEAILEAGYCPIDALKAGYAPHAVVSAAQHDLKGLKDAGVSVKGCLTAPCVPQLAARLQEGPRGLLMLKRAGYTLQDVMEGGLDRPWDLKKAGFSFEELVDAGITPLELRGAGFGAKESMPVTTLARSMATLMLETDARTIPPILEGAQNIPWLQSAVQAHQAHHNARSPDMGMGKSVRASQAVQSGMVRASLTTTHRAASPGPGSASPSAPIASHSHHPTTLTGTPSLPRAAT